MAAAHSTGITRIGPPGALPYSRAVTAGGFIYLSGRLAHDEHGVLTGGGGIGAETRWTLESLQQVLAAAGSSLRHVVSATVYIASASHFAAMNAAYREFWPDDPPSRTTIVTGLVVPEALVEISLIAVPSGAERIIIHPAGWMRSPNPYSYGVRCGDTLFLSGLVPRRGRDNTAVTGDIRAQTRAIVDNAAEVLDAAGMTLADVVSARVYLTDAADFAGMNEVYGASLPGAPPARATVVCGLAGPDFRVEMTFTASARPREALGTPPAGVPLSASIRAGQHLYVSGMLGVTPETRRDVSAQTRETLARLDRVLADSGASRNDVVDATVYLTEASAFDAMNAEYRAFFGEALPARTTVVTGLVVPDGLVEIVITALAR